MRVCVTAEGDSLDSYVSDDFGHAPFFLVVDTDTMEFRAVDNPARFAEGAGMKAAEAVASLGVEAVLTGGVGPHGMAILGRAGIMVSMDEDGAAGECVRDFARRRSRA
jgi:predicted Fe-Mo cluster-binding NifX family protein